jgi:cytidine deaminase
MSATKKKTSKKGAAPNNADRDEAAQIVAALVQAARDVRANAYAPYSKYKVGAAILTEAGDVFVGCNVENASYPAGICAERGAIMSMVAAGAKKPVACAIVTQGKQGGSPCGICRQMLVELSEDMTIIMAGESGGPSDLRIASLSDLLPDAFKGSSLKKR